MKYKLNYIAGLLGASIGVSGFILVISAVTYYHNEPIPSFGMYEILILLTCCFFGFANSLIGFNFSGKKTLIIYFLPLVLPLMTLLTGEFEPKVGALFHVSLIEAIFVWIAGSTGIQLKKSSTIKQNAIGAKRLL
ncbi:MAG: hypothetical protein WCJ06_09855 [Planctomycetota bacterium]